MNLFFLLPCLIPLLGTWLLWVWPRQRWTQIERGCYLAILWLTPLSLSFAVGRVAQLPNVSAAAEAFMWHEGLLLRYDALGIVLSLALMIPLTLAETGRPHNHSRSQLTCLLFAVGALACVSGNLLGLCLAWGVSDLVSLFLLRSSAEGQIERRTARVALTGVLSTVALMVATTLLAIDLGHTQFDAATASRDVLSWLALAAILRLAPWPLQANYTSLPLAHLGLILGGGLWLRVAPGLVNAGVGLPWPAASLLLLSSALLALVTSRERSPYLLLPGLALIVLAPLTGAAVGTGVAALMIVDLVLICGYWLLLPSFERALPVRWSRYARLPLLLCLGGAPLTVGFCAYLGCLTTLSALSPMAWVAVGGALLLLDAALWRRWLVAREGKEADVPPGLDRWLTLGAGALLILAMVILGFAPRLLGGEGFDVPGMGLLLRTPGGWGRLLAVFVVPATLGFGLAWLLSGRLPLLGEILARLGTALELDWLYAGLEAGLARIGRWGASALVQVEGALALTWTLSWGLILVLLLMEGG